MRDSSPGLAAAFGEGARGEGADVVDAGLASTDLLYFASGSLDIPGAMFTASHNPAQYNGIKLCRVGREADRPGHRAGRDPRPCSGDARRRSVHSASPTGAVEQRDMLAEYAAHLRILVDLSGIRPLTVVVDAGNGMAGHTVPAVLGDAVLPAYR